jgi:hypothetical protein
VEQRTACRLVTVSFLGRYSSVWNNRQTETGQWSEKTIHHASANTSTFVDSTVFRAFHTGRVYQDRSDLNNIYKASGAKRDFTRDVTLPVLI